MPLSTLYQSYHRDISHIHVFLDFNSGRPGLWNVLPKDTPVDLMRVESGSRVLQFTSEPHATSLSLVYTQNFKKRNKDIQAIVTLILTFPVIHLLCEEYRSRSDCTCVQSDLDLHSTLFYHQFLSTNPIQYHFTNLNLFEKSLAIQIRQR